MAIRITCPACKTAFTLAENLCGQTIRCTSCQQLFRIGQLRQKEEPAGALVLEDASRPVPPIDLETTAPEPPTEKSDPSRQQQPARSGPRETTADDFDLGGISVPDDTGRPPRPARPSGPSRQG